METRLIYKPGDGKVQEFSVRRLPVLLGRSEAADVRMSDRWVSRQHCRIEEREGVLVVKDLGSRHGTWLNDRRVEVAEVHAGDELSLGGITLQVEYEECTRPSTTAV